MDKQAILNQLCQLYRLKDEGKNVQKEIDDLEEKLCEACEQDKKVGKEAFE